MLPVMPRQSASLLDATFAPRQLPVGALVWVGAELVGGYAGLAGPLTALGGAATVVGFAVFAVGLWASLGRLPGRAGA
jgi:hypothetical protein